MNAGESASRDLGKKRKLLERQVRMEVEKARAPIDRLKTLTDRRGWSLPKHDELLFHV